MKTGLFGTSASFVPLDRADDTGESLRVPYTKDEVKDAPRTNTGTELSEAEEQRLYEHYEGAFNLLHGTTDATSPADASPRVTQTEGHDTSGPTTDDAMTRSEEQLHVGTERVQTGRPRLRKHAVTEQETVAVPVSHEEVRLEREPITDANTDDAPDGPALSEEEHEVVLTEQRPVIEKETVPVERVRLGTNTVESTDTVRADVRKEEVTLEDDSPTQR